jgi:hypothetical protein
LIKVKTHFAKSDRALRQVGVAVPISREAAMHRPTALVGACVLALAVFGTLTFVAIGTGTPRLQAPDQTQFVTGWVRLSTSSSGLATVVTVTTRGSAADTPSTVVAAYRIQHPKPRTLAFEGWAAVQFQSKRLTVLSASGTAWQFVVSDPDAADAFPTADFQRIGVVGLSRHWGWQVDGDQYDVASKLLAAVCGTSGAAADMSGGCGSCAWGGPGITLCEANCGPTEGCSAECGPGYYACCNCPSSCSCCRDIETRPSAW